MAERESRESGRSVEGEVGHGAARGVTGTARPRRAEGQCLRDLTGGKALVGGAGGGVSVQVKAART